MSHFPHKSPIHPHVVKVLDRGCIQKVLTLHGLQGSILAAIINYATGGKTTCLPQPEKPKAQSGKAHSLLKIKKSPFHHSSSIKSKPRVL